METDPDRLAQFLYNQRNRIDILKEDNAIYRAGLSSDEQHWRSIRELYVERGDSPKANAVEKELSRITSERQHYERESNHLDTLSEIIDDVKALPDVRERFRRIEQVQRSVGIESRRLMR